MSGSAVLPNANEVNEKPDSIQDRILFADRREQLIATARRLVAVASPNPPLSTEAIAEASEAVLKELIPEAVITLHRASNEVVNVIAVLKSGRPGRRLVLNGHLDTYPIGEHLPWTVDPLGGELREERLYGRGVCDMKGGIAASMAAMATLAEFRDAWQGELIMTLGGDEESMGELGAKWLLDNVPEARGDATIIGDVGSPLVVRYGEKGFLWVTVEAEGVAAHGAHVHRGINAIDRLRAAMDAIAKIANHPVRTPDTIKLSIHSAREISERLSGVGESDVLTSVTVNFGRIEGGVSPNLVPSQARVAADIRVPIGVRSSDLEHLLRETLGGMDGIRLTIDRHVEPSFTDPDHEIIRQTVASATRVLGSAPVTNMRVGGSDARVFRAAGIPTVVYGPTPFNMGGADEYVDVDELESVMRVHALTAFKFLTPRT